MDALDPDHNGVARFVGGPVRNALMGIKVGDIDIATSWTPEDVLRKAETAGLKAIPTGIEHGTVTVLSDGYPYEVTTLRVDLATDGRHATVGFTQDWAEDAKRRDFTMNALYCDRDGTVHDPLGGHADLEARRVRFVGEPVERIREDVLRILRFYRFFAHYGIGVADEAARQACRLSASMIPGLSGERVRDELLKLLRADRAAETLRLMQEDGVLDPVLTGPVLMGQVLTGSSHIDRFENLVSAVPTSDPIQRLAALAGPPVDALTDRLKLSNKEGARLAASWADWPVVPEIVHRAFYHHGPEAMLDRAAFLVAIGSLSSADFEVVNSKARDWQRPVFPLTGADAKAAGVVPGPQMGQILRSVEAWWVDNDFTPDKDACLRELVARI